MQRPQRGSLRNVPDVEARIPLTQACAASSEASRPSVSWRVAMASLLAMLVEGVARATPRPPGWNRSRLGPALHGGSHGARPPRDRGRLPPIDRMEATAGPAATQAPPRRARRSDASTADDQPGAWTASRAESPRVAATASGAACHPASSFKSILRGGHCRHLDARLTPRARYRTRVAKSSE